MTDLIRDLEAATEGSRELSDRVLRADPANVHADGGWARASWYHESYRPDPTRSLDDALARVPEGWTNHALYWDTKFDEPARALLGEPGHREAGGSGANIILAVCIAVLKAQEQDR